MEPTNPVAEFPWPNFRGRISVAVIRNTGDVSLVLEDLFYDLADPRTGPFNGWKDDDWYAEKFGNWDFRDYPVCK